MATNTLKILQFSEIEKKIIQSLSSDSYTKKTDLSNYFIGKPDAIVLGKALFFEQRLSGNHKVSCATCHNPETFWSDHLTITNLYVHQKAKRHTPSLWGVRYNRWYFWDGRSDSLWNQALSPIESVFEMNGSRLQVANLIIKDKTLRKMYQKVFGSLPKALTQTTLPKKGKISQPAWKKLPKLVQQEINRLFVNTGKAIASFESTIIATNTAFDRFAKQLKELSTDKPSISITAMRGLKLFIGKGQCINCHSGANFSDGEFHHSFLDTKDLGRYEGILKLKKDPFNGKSIYSDIYTKKIPNKIDYIYRNIAFKQQFKTPSLRNVALTYPYMHTGELKTLKEVLEFYNNISERIKKNNHKEALLFSIHLSKQEQQNIIAFLNTLTDTSTLDFKL